MKMMPPDVISHENQLQHLSQPSIFILDVFRTADHAGQIFIPHRPTHSRSDSLFARIGLRTSGSRTSETGGQIFAEIFERPFLGVPEKISEFPPKIFHLSPKISDDFF